MRKANALAEEVLYRGALGAEGPPPQVVQLEALGEKIGVTDMVLKVLVTILYDLQPASVVTGDGSSWSWSPEEVWGELEDDFHHFGVTVVHRDGQVVA